MRMTSFSALAAGSGRWEEIPDLGIGVGLRSPIEALLREHSDRIDWLEVITEMFLFDMRQREAVLSLSGQFTLVPHGVELSIGGDEEPDSAYLDAVAEFVAMAGSPWFSDHLCFTRAGAIAVGALIPLSRTYEVAALVAGRAQRIQDHVGVPFLLENVSTYFDVGGELSDAEFVTEILERCDCGMLLDVTNVYNNSVNLHFDPVEYIDAIPLERVLQFHVAGGTWANGLLQDDHSADVHEQAWELLEYALPRSRAKGVLIERDGKLPDDFPNILSDAERARSISATVRALVAP
jgi:uncharacterized protein (UPF0276 family)